MRTTLGKQAAKAVWSTFKAWPTCEIDTFRHFAWNMPNTLMLAVPEPLLPIARMTLIFELE